MKCKRCGHILPSTGFICINCKTMMSVDQIKVQKENMKLTRPRTVELVSEKYGLKKQVYEKRNDSNSKKYFYFIILLSIFLLFFCFLLFVYL